MKKTLLIATGMAAGYVLGAKAGHERYEQIVATARSLGERAGLLEPEEHGRHHGGEDTVSYGEHTSGLGYGDAGSRYGSEPVTDITDASAGMPGHTAR